MAEDDQFELEESLVSQRPNTAHLDIISVQVLEEPLHPPDHDLVVPPSQVKFLQKLFAFEVLKARLDLLLQVFGNGLGISCIQFSLEAFNLLDAQIVDFGVDLHVLHLGELDLVAVSRGEELLQGLNCFLSQIGPLLVQHVMVVYYHIVGLLTVNVTLIAK